MHNVSNACRRSADELLQCLQLAVEQRKIPFRQAGYDSASVLFGLLAVKTITLNWNYVQSKEE